MWGDLTELSGCTLYLVRVHVSAGVGEPTCAVWVRPVLGDAICICRCGWTYLSCLVKACTW